MAEAWACMMVSKLKPVPFHSVNSPLLDAVKSRLPSGVHRTTLMGCLILLRDECRWRMGTVSAALVAIGGNICILISCHPLRTGRLSAYINDVAGAWPRNLAPVRTPVPRLPVAHPVHESRPVVSHGAYR